MFRSFTVKNFRCFRDLTIGNLQRVNLIAGRNNTGKTALLEALQIHSSPQDCELPFLVNQLRSPEALRKYSQEVAGWLFHDKQGDNGLELLSEDEEGHMRSLRCWLMDAASATARFPELQRWLESPFARLLWNSGRPWLILRGESDGQATMAVAVPQETETGNGLGSLGNSPVTWYGPSRFLGSGPSSSEADAAAFSELEATNRQGEVVANLTFLEPRLKRLSLLLVGGKPVIHGELCGVSRLVPVPFMGEGLRRLLSLLLAIAGASGGRVLVDEIENGLHYSVLKDVWKAVAQAARQAEVQVFATTHSWECVRWAHEAFAEGPAYDLRLYRLDRTPEGVAAVTYDQEQIESALFNAVEMR
ncbi:MAG TPA: AAA family ATPase [Gemmataceae bacterium]|nr:AAA family ATPase [Gemmataceae bacterium]